LPFFWYLTNTVDEPQKKALFILPGVAQRAALWLM
jgi:hypothetical protein